MAVSGQQTLILYWCLCTTKDKLEDMDSFFQLPKEGHDFYKAAMTQQIRRFPILCSQAKDMVIIFPQMPLPFCLL